MSTGLNGTSRNLWAMAMARDQVKWYADEKNGFFAVRVPVAVYVALKSAGFTHAKPLQQSFTQNGDTDGYWVAFATRGDADRLAVAALATLAFWGVRYFRDLQRGEPVPRYFARWVVDRMPPGNPSGPPWIKAEEVLGVILRETKALYIQQKGAVDA